jgi:hypothetical protein
VENYEKFMALLANSSAVKLLRARHAPLILGFLFREFKAKQRLTVPNTELVAKLADYLEGLRFTDKEEFADELQYPNYMTRAAKYIDEWCNEQNRYLSKYQDDSATSVHELTPGTEKAFQWVESLERKEFIGTESRFLDIFAKLKELIENSSGDPQKRIAELEEKKAQIEAQIREIQRTGKAEIFSDTQVKERFFEINRLGRELISDFKEVEQNFREITRKIYDQQIHRDISKGAILGYTLDATDALKKSDQGKSFDAFWRFLLSDSRQEELNRLVNTTFDILDNRNVPKPDSFLRYIKSYLHSAGQKVVVSNHRMVERLSRILGEKFFRERRKTLELISEIIKLAASRVDNPPDDKSFVGMEEGPLVQLPMERPIGREPQSATFSRQPNQVGSRQTGEVNFNDLFDEFEIDREKLNDNIRAVLEKQDQVTLGELIENYPITRGIAEIVAYLSIASASMKHIIDSNAFVKIQWTEKDAVKTVRMPRVIYTK